MLKAMSSVNPPHFECQNAGQGQGRDRAGVEAGSRQGQGWGWGRGKAGTGLRLGTDPRSVILIPAPKECIRVCI